MRGLLLSVKPVYAHALLDGRKTIEIRRKFPAQQPGTPVFIYASSPERQLLGTVQLDSIELLEPDLVWEKHRSVIEIGRSALSTYARGLDRVSMLRVRDPKLLSRPVSLSSMRSLARLEPPQSFRYLTEEQQRVLLHAGEQLLEPVVDLIAG
jgi:predicted transcriptional regulator